MEECFEDLSGHIYAVETGLSTDPAMNWMCSFLDQYTLLSNSDAHSPEKLGRNANLFKSELCYTGMVNAMKEGTPDKFGGTFDMFPQEGKYHYDGHRKCGVRWDPVETLRHRGICPVCGKKVTVGVTNRVVELSDREDIKERKNRLPFYSIIPLKEMLAEIEGVGEKSKKITKKYEQLIEKAGSEFNLLHFLPQEELKKFGGEVLAEGIRRMRNHEVIINEGYDGEYGQIKVFQPDEVKYLSTQESLFDVTNQFKQNPKRGLINFSLEEYQKLEQLYKTNTNVAGDQPEYAIEGKGVMKGLNHQQIKAASHENGAAAVMAGPGTGKTRVLTHRIAHLVKEEGIEPGHILAITFTNKAAEEMEGRCFHLLNDNEAVRNINVSTFHAFGYQILQKYENNNNGESLTILDESGKQDFISGLFSVGVREAQRYASAFSAIKQEIKEAEDIGDNEFKSAFNEYMNKLSHYELYDLDDLIYRPVKLMLKNTEIRKALQKQYQWILVDEFQDINAIQYRMLQLLTDEDPNPNLYIIGDPNQAIYGFRGSSTKFISRFIEDYKQTEIYKLDTSYRCSKNILRASSDILQEEGLNGLNDGVKIKISQQQTDKSEAEYIARTIEQLSGGLRFFSMDSRITQGEGDANIESLSDFAILCRTKAQMKTIEKALLDHTIPYQLIAEDEFFKNPLVRKIRDLLVLSEDQNNKFLLEKFQKDKPVLEDSGELAEALNQLDNVNKKIDTIHRKLNYKDEDGKEVVEKLRQIGSRYGNDLPGFLKYLSLGAGPDLHETNTEKVTVMTLHASKGLEFKCVFIAGCENGLLPYALYKNMEVDTEEEKRLLYVGMTRAQDYLYLTHARKRYLFGKQQDMQRSPFLNKIEKELTEIEKGTFRKKQEDDKQLKLF
jgi:superfamily I DNA/RNA helicase